MDTTVLIGVLALILVMMAFFVVVTRIRRRSRQPPLKAEEEGVWNVESAWKEDGAPILVESATNPAHALDSAGDGDASTPPASPRFSVPGPPPEAPPMSHEGGVDALRIAPVLDLPLPEAIPLREASINPVLWGFDGNSQTDRDLGILSLDEQFGGFDPTPAAPTAAPPSPKAPPANEPDELFEEDGFGEVAHTFGRPIPSGAHDNVVAGEQYTYGFGDEGAAELDVEGDTEGADADAAPLTWKDFQNDFDEDPPASAPQSAPLADAVDAGAGTPVDAALSDPAATPPSPGLPDSAEPEGAGEELSEALAPAPDPVPSSAHVQVAATAEAPIPTHAAALSATVSSAPSRVASPAFDEDESDGTIADDPTPLDFFDPVLATIVRLEATSESLGYTVVDHVGILYEAAYRVRDFLRIAPQGSPSHPDIARVRRELGDLCAESRDHLDEVAAGAAGRRHCEAVHEAVQALRWIHLGETAEQTTDEHVARHGDTVATLLGGLAPEQWSAELQEVLAGVHDVVAVFHAPLPQWRATVPPIARHHRPFPPLPPALAAPDAARLTTLREAFAARLARLRRDLARREHSPQEVAVKGRLGAGAFGEVVLATTRAKEDRAIKVAPKAAVVAAGQVEHAVAERDLLMCCDAPQIVRLYGSGQDSQALYLVLECCPRGDLQAAVERAKGGCLDPQQCRFVAAEIALALEYLHALHVAYRDLKPANVLIDAKGHLRVADFGFARRLPESGTTYTMCGTPDYMAPEILRNRGHGLGVDWWAYGVVLFQLRAGYCPFSARTEDETCYKITSGALKFPAEPSFTPEEEGLVRALLHGAIGSRLGCDSLGPAAVLGHPYFTVVEWPAVRMQTSVSPLLTLPANPVVSEVEEARLTITAQADDDGYGLVFSGF